MTDPKTCACGKNYAIWCESGPVPGCYCPRVESGPQPPCRTSCHATFTMYPCKCDEEKLNE